MLGQAFIGIGKPLEAFRAYETALELRPEHTPWQLELATAAMDANLKEKARAVLDEILHATRITSRARTMREGLDQ